MIEVFEGRIGGGKTYSALVRIVGRLCSGGVVYTNIDLFPEKVRQYIQAEFGLVIDENALKKLTDEQIATFHRETPNNCLVVIDECHLWFNNRDWDKTSRELLNFLTQSRKYKNDIIFISQSAENIDKQFRRLVQFIWRFRDMEYWTRSKLGLSVDGQFGKELRNLCPYILQIQFDYDGKTLIRREFKKKDKNIFELYDTNATHKVAYERLPAPLVKEPEKCKKYQKRMVMKVLAILALAAIFGLFYVGGKMRHAADPKATPPAAPAASPAVLPGGTIVAPVVPPPPVVSAQQKPIDEKKIDFFKPVITEVFRGQIGYDVLCTENEEYWGGDFCSKGRVVLIGDRYCEIIDGKGRKLTILAIQGRPSVDQASESVPAVPETSVANVKL
ncbi:MAG: zonular occludens toxin domain-containing protein [Verrucomicrobiae bacterium]|nr:zonular occludens toxin domain-containing protein [Verrucomicrobiae bacterium]